MPRTKEQFEAIRNKTKHKILTNALDLFSEKGFKGTSINDIAKSAGISKGLAYNYFKDKNEIMLNVFGLLAEEIGRIYSKVETESNPSKKLEKLIDQTFRALKSDEKFWRIYMIFTLSPEVKEEANQFLSKFLNEIFSELEKLFKSLGYKNAALESKIFGAELDGICFHYLIDKENYPLEKMQKYLTKKYSVH
jgi:AcrR family transcriptional regulator